MPELLKTFAYHSIYVIDIFFHLQKKKNHNHLKFVEEIINSYLGIYYVPGTYWAIHKDVSGWQNK